MADPCTEASRLSSIDAKLLALHDTIGEAPNAATGDPGHGMARTLAEIAMLVREHIESSVSSAELAKAESEARVRLAKVVATAATGIATTIAGALTAMYMVK